MDLPKNIVLEQLPGPKRGDWPALYFRDEVAWSPSRTHLALAYTICEASMCNEVGCILWAEVDGGKATILQNPDSMVASCWRSPWCRWLNESIFVFKSQWYNGENLCLPLVAIHVNKGFQVLAGTNTAEQWLDDFPMFDGQWTPFGIQKLLKQIGEAGRE